MQRKRNNTINLRIIDSFTEIKVKKIVEISKKLLPRKRMALNEDTAEWKRSDYVVRDYPLENKFTAMYSTAMMDAGFLENVEQAVKMVRKVNCTHEFSLLSRKPRS